jgi:DNA-directed RNA polymerase specialized sigma24 family protein
MADSKIAYQEDYEFTKQLFSGGSDAWDRFYNEFRKKLEIYISLKYPDTFGVAAIEEIFDGVGKRLIENDFKALRGYRGECSFSTYITKATEWEIKDWLRKHSGELMNEPIDTIGTDYKISKNYESRHAALHLEEQENIPPSIKSLKDDLRFAFLLRYYDYFGFPPDEIRRLAKKKGIPSGSITEKIAKFFDPAGKDILRVQREQQSAFQKRLQKVCYEIHKLNIKEHSAVNNDYYDAKRSDNLAEIRNRRSDLEKKRDNLLKDKSKVVITTPYEVVAEILGEDNVSTIRSRVFLAKKQLAQLIMVKNG